MREEKRRARGIQRSSQKSKCVGWGWVGLGGVGWGTGGRGRMEKCVGAGSRGVIGGAWARQPCVWGRGGGGDRKTIGHGDLGSCSRVALDAYLECGPLRSDAFAYVRRRGPIDSQAVGARWSVGEEVGTRPTARAVYLSSICNSR
jgi:hypothetical protein